MFAHLIEQQWLASLRSIYFGSFLSISDIMQKYDGESYLQHTPFFRLDLVATKEIN